MAGLFGRTVIFKEGEGWDVVITLPRVVGFCPAHFRLASHVVCTIAHSLWYGPNSRLRYRDSGGNGSCILYSYLRL